jgi:hypothetical protein
MHRGPRRDPDRARACGCAGAGSAGRSAASGAPPCGGAAHRRGRSHRRSPRGAPRRQRPRRAGHRSAAARTTPRRPREGRRATHTPNQARCGSSKRPASGSCSARPSASASCRKTAPHGRPRSCSGRHRLDGRARAGRPRPCVRPAEAERARRPRAQHLLPRHAPNPRRRGAWAGPPGSSDRYPRGRSRSPLARYRRRGRTRATRTRKRASPSPSWPVVTSSRQPPTRGRRRPALTCRWRRTLRGWSDRTRGRRGSRGTRCTRPGRPGGCRSSPAGRRRCPRRSAGS